MHQAEQKLQRAKQLHASPLIVSDKGANQDEMSNGNQQRHSLGHILFLLPSSQQVSPLEEAQPASLEEELGRAIGRDAARLPLTYAIDNLLILSQNLIAPQPVMRKAMMLRNLFCDLDT